MTREHVEAQLPMLVDGSLSANDRAQVLAHLGACERCRASHAAFERVARALADVPPPEPIAPMWPVVQERMTRGVSFVFDGALAAAATAALAAGFLFGILAFDGARTRSPEQVVSASATSASSETDWLSSSEPTLYDVYVAGAATQGATP